MAHLGTPHSFPIWQFGLETLGIVSLATLYKNDRH